MATKVQSSPRLQQPLPPLSPVERELVCVVLEDCADQLAVLGGIVPNYAEKPSAVEAVSGYVSDSHSDGCLSTWYHLFKLTACAVYISDQSVYMLVSIPGLLRNVLEAVQYCV